jgi:DNA modification methylase
VRYGLWFRRNQGSSEVPGKKHFKGEKAGQYSCNPLGKNPGDIWTIPNVKHNHVEKTIHPCQFPIELVEHLVLALTNRDDLVVDPYIGVGSAACAALLHGRRAAGADTVASYLQVARERELNVVSKDSCGGVPWAARFTNLPPMIQLLGAQKIYRG